MEKKEEIISNKIKCKKCGNIIESKSTNDYKRCSCGAGRFLTLSALFFNELF